MYHQHAGAFGREGVVPGKITFHQGVAVAVFQLFAYHLGLGEDGQQ
jgi:hypothetical protein